MKKINTELAQQVVDYGKKMFRAGLVTGTGGNISVRVPGENAYLISPSGMPYEEVTVDDIVMIDFEGNQIGGKRRPSVEKNMHRLILKNRPEFNAVIHTHSTYASAYASLRRPLPVFLDVMSCVFGGPVPVAEYARIGSEELAVNVEKAMRGTNVVLIANHGSIGAADSLEFAYGNVELLEVCCKSYFAACAAGVPISVSDEDVRLTVEEQAKKYGQKGKD
ncbi:MAG TPA: class II aldolase/adducin family protein [Firmicutes bacterium]|nr:class II aldolase/adducin family protein [Bacillota bacterium]